MVDTETPQVVAAVQAGSSGFAADIIATSALMKQAVDQGAACTEAITTVEIPALSIIAASLQELYSIDTSDEYPPDGLNPQLIQATRDGKNVQPLAIGALEEYIDNL